MSIQVLFLLYFFLSEKANKVLHRWRVLAFIGSLRVKNVQLKCKNSLDQFRTHLPLALHEALLKSMKEQRVLKRSILHRKERLQFSYPMERDKTVLS